MDMKDAIRDLAKRSRKAKETAETEEATKNAIILPMIRAFGFDIFDLHEVIPEFTADVGLKKGEKVDYALKVNEKISALIEVKSVNTDLSKSHFSQLYRYFAVTDARIGILTNGCQVWFFTDIDEKNKMDKRPFFVFDFENYDDEDVREISKFHKDKFNIDSIVETASLLKYQSAAVSFLKSQMADPDDEFVKFVGRNIYEGSMTKQVTEQLRGPVKSAFQAMIRDHIQERLNIALSDQNPQPKPVEVVAEPDATNTEIETTEEEWQAYYIVCAIASEKMAASRVVIRDQKSYCAVLVDDNNRRPICRFYFNAKSVKHVGFFNNEKKEERVTIAEVRDIYAHKDKILAAVESYL